VSATIIRNGRLIDPANNRDEIADLVIVDGRIAEKSEIRNPKSEKKINPLGFGFGISDFGFSGNLRLSVSRTARRNPKSEFPNPKLLTPVLHE
jgi:formylmethanofuran dehydrogenase subunit A